LTEIQRLISKDFLPPKCGLPHTLIEPLRVRAAKALLGKGAPADKGYIKIYSNDFGFAALKADGSIKAWTDSGSGRKRAPAGQNLDYPTP
jgi:hypothetical protein